MEHPSHWILVLARVSREVQDGAEALLGAGPMEGLPPPMPGWRELKAPGASQEALCTSQDQACRLCYSQGATCTFNCSPLPNYSTWEMSGEADTRVLVQYCSNSPASHRHIPLVCGFCLGNQHTTLPSHCPRQQVNPWQLLCQPLKNVTRPPCSVGAFICKAPTSFRPRSHGVCCPEEPLCDP